MVNGKGTCTLFHLESIVLKIQSESIELPYNRAKCVVVVFL